MTVTTFTATGYVQTYTVPAGITNVFLECYGAAGRSGAGSFAGAGGPGGYSRGRLVVTGGQVLQVYVGTTPGTAGGGWNGGGAGGSGDANGGGGGGASDVRTSPALEDRVIVAGGGGGGGSGPYFVAAINGGVGGGSTGTPGYWNGAGQPGTQAGGYALGTGGDGGSGGGTPTSGGGGGGGGGYYGGFGCTDITPGGAPAAGGGGGSGFVSRLLTEASMSTNGNAGMPPKVVITAVGVYPLAPTITSPAANSSIFSAEDNTVTWVFNDEVGDWQLNANARYKKAGDPSWTTLTAVTGTYPAWLIPAGTWAQGFQYEYQVQTTDSGGGLGPWSASRFVNTINTIPAPTITSPASGALLYASPVELDWTLPAGWTCDGYMVQRASASDGSGVVYYAGPQVLTTAPTASVPLDNVMGRTDWLRVAFRYAGHWSAWASVDVVTQLSPPMVPVVTAYQP